MMITKDTRIGDVIRMDMGAAPILQEMGMHCLGCPASQVETLAEAAQVHGVDADQLVGKINAYFQEKAQMVADE